MKCGRFILYKMISAALNYPTIGKLLLSIRAESLWQLYILIPSLSFNYVVELFTGIVKPQKMGWGSRVVPFESF